MMSALKITAEEIADPPEYGQPQLVSGDAVAGMRTDKTKSPGMMAKYLATGSVGYENVSKSALAGDSQLFSNFPRFSISFCGLNRMSTHVCRLSLGGLLRAGVHGDPPEREGSLRPCASALGHHSWPSPVMATSCALGLVSPA